MMVRTPADPAVSTASAASEGTASGADGVDRTLWAVWAPPVAAAVFVPLQEPAARLAVNKSNAITPMMARGICLHSDKSVISVPAPILLATFVPSPLNL